MKELGSKVESSKARAATRVQDWTAERRHSYYEAFLDHPVLSTLSGGSGGTGTGASGGTGSLTELIAKIAVFIGLSETDLDDLMTMQLILAQDIQAGGSLAKQLVSVCIHAYMRVIAVYIYISICTYILPICTCI